MKYAASAISMLGAFVLDTLGNGEWAVGGLLLGVALFAWAEYDEACRYRASIAR